MTTAIPNAYPPGKVPASVTTAPPFDRPPVTVRVEGVGDIAGHALAWTSDLVMAQVPIGNVQHIVWMKASDVQKRTLSYP